MAIADLNAMEVQQWIVREVHRQQGARPASVGHPDGLPHTGVIVIVPLDGSWVPLCNVPLMLLL